MSSRMGMLRRLRRGVAIVLAIVALPATLAARAADVITRPQGQGVLVEFDTDEGTWMSVDVAPDGSWLVFDLLGHIYRLPAQGGDAVCLTDDSGTAANYHPRISPDGREIAFISDRSGQDNLWVMRADGSGSRPVWQDQATRSVEPAWTPDGQAILFTRRMRTELGLYRTHDRIWRVSRQGGGAELIFGTDEFAPLPSEFEGEQRYQWPSVSPDGRFVYFTASNFAGDERRIQRFDLLKRQIDSITETFGAYTASGRPPYPLLMGEFGAEISPDGQSLAFARRIPGAVTSFRGHEYAGRTALWLQDLRTGEERKVMDPITVDGSTGHPPWNARVLPGYAWAKDNRSIVISQGGKLWRLDLASGAVTPIPFRAHVRRQLSRMSRSHISVNDSTFEPKAIRWAASSPDGKRLAFEAIGQLWIMDLPSGTPQPLTGPSPAGVELMPAWSPDGRSIAYATSSGAQGGHVYKIDPQRGEPERLTLHPAIYAWPSWSADGKWVFVNTWPNGLRRRASRQGSPDPQWELARLDASRAGDPVTLMKSRTTSRIAAGAAGRLSFLEPYELASSVPRHASELPRGYALVSVDPSGADRRIEVEIPAFIDRALPSPDGNWLAVEWRQDVYLMPRPGEKRPVVLDPHSADSGVRRLSRTGGYFSRWRNSRIVEFTIGNEYYTYDVVSRKTTMVPIRLRVSRDVPQGTIALANARIVTLDGRRRVLERATVLVDGSRIACVGRCSTSGAGRIIDLDGATIVPGFVDHHAHHLAGDAEGIVPRQRNRSAAYLVHGVTTVLDPGAPNKSAFAIGEMIEAGRIVGPRTYTAGWLLLCMDEGAYNTAQRDILTLEDAQEHVDRQVKLGAVAIKDYKLCTRTAREFVAEAARRRNVSVVAEAGDLIYNLGLIMSGYTGWEHSLQHVPIYKDVSTFLGQAGAHHTPNHIISDFPHGTALEYWLSAADYWNDRKVQLWFPWQQIAGRRTFVKKPLREYFFPILAEGSADIQRAGGHIAIGDHGEFPGLAHHWELWSNAMAMKPMEALAAATLGSAHYLGMEHEIGSIERGKLADLIVLNGNPLEDIRRTADIRLVMKGGRLYDGMTLDEVWPEQRPYGERPWFNREIFDPEVRDDRYWQTHPGAPGGLSQ